MGNKIKFKVSDKLVKARDGKSYDIKNYVEGVDYVMRGCFKGVKAVFRADIFSCDKPQVEQVSDKSDQVDEFNAMQGTRATLELDEKGLRIVFPSEPEPQPEDWRPAAPEREEPPKTSGHNVKTAKVRRIHVNNRWIETDIGRIWAGAKGGNLKVGQIIRVLNGELYLGKTEPSGSFVRI